MRYCEDRAPLEYGAGSKSKILVICPKCNTGQYVTKSWYSGVCLGCKEWFNKDNCLTDQSECKDIKSDKKIIDAEFVKRKEKMERDAHEWKENQIKSGKWGRSHEPGGGERKW